MSYRDALLAVPFALAPASEPAAQLADPIPTPIPQSTIAVEIADFVTIPASDANDSAKARLNFMSPVGDGSGRLFVNDSRGQLWVTDHQGSTPTLFLDHDDINGLDFNGIFSGERGFAGFAFHPNFANPGQDGYRKFYTSYSAANPAPTNFDDTLAGNPSHYSVVTEWTVDDPSANTFSGSFREVVSFAQPFGNHNIGQISFNPNATAGGSDFGNLYIALGDGGSGGDPLGNAQAKDQPLGKILRINPLQDGSNPYSVPTNAPHAGDSSFLPEIWAYGLRNPQRFSWDPAGTGQMFISDIGQNFIEEINLGAEGANYGWQPREGTFKSVSGGVDAVQPGDDAGLNFTYPVLEYDHVDTTFDDSRFNFQDRRATVTGFVYRGSAIPDLYGHLLFADFVLGTVFHAPVDELVPGSPIAFEELRLVKDGAETTLFDLSATANRVDLRFGIDEDGELYLLNKRDGIIRKLVGQILPLAGDYDGDGEVGQSDLDLVLNNWGDAVTEGESPDPLWTNSDAVTASVIGLDELARVLQNWGAASPLADELGAISDATGLDEGEVRSLIPEPATVGLLLIAGAGVLLRRRGTEGRV